MMKYKKIIFLTSLSMLFLMAGWVFLLWLDNGSVPVEKDTIVEKIEDKVELESVAPAIEEYQGFVAPLDRSEERITKKPFGIFITPETSPVDNEKFRGLHSGVDWEVFENEIDIEVAVKAVCSGKLIYKRNASGYGGVAVEQCDLEGDQATIIYGHMDLASIRLAAGEQIEAGIFLGNLGDHKSAETDGERKHLHLGIHKGRNIELRGYVDSNEELSHWIDPCLYVCKNL